jgi:hypothetical protein
MKSIKFFASILTILFLASCDKDDANVNNANTVMPEIDSLIVNNTRIQSGSGEPAIFNCYATGGNLNYVWEVDLGDLFVTNDEGSEAQYTASPCCVGDRTITCTVSNDKGEASTSLTITIND